MSLLRTVSNSSEGHAKRMISKISNSGPEALPRTGSINIEFVSTEPLSVEIKYRSRTAPPTLPMVKTYASDMDWQAESPARWSAASAFKKFLAEPKS